jgi:hypothetical protein
VPVRGCSGSKQWGLVGASKGAALEISAEEAECLYACSS